MLGANGVRAPALTEVSALSTWQVQLLQPHSQRWCLGIEQLGQVIFPGFPQCLFEPVEGCELPQCLVARSFRAELQGV